MTITKRLVKGTALTQAELDGNFTDYETFKALFDTTTLSAGNDGKLLYWNNSTSNVEVKTATTSEVSEGTNLYFTDGRADARADGRITAVVTKPFVDNLYASVPAQNSFSITTSDFNALAAVRYMVDTTGGVVTATLPGTPATGDTIEFTNGAGSFVTNNLIINRNGNTIDGAASNLTVSATPIAGILTIVYDGTTWRSDATTTNTDQIPEGSSNFYYTDTKVDGRIALQVGANLDLSSKSTTDLSEGTNLYYTDGRADARATLRINAASITNLNDVDAVVAGDDGKFLYYDHSSTSFKWTATIPGYYSLADWKTLIAASTDFADFQSRVAAL